MVKIIYKHYKDEELAQIIEYFKQGKKTPYISRQMGRPYGGITYLKVQYNKILAGKPTSYIERFKKFMEPETNGQTVSYTKSDYSREDDLVSLERAFANFQEAIASVIEHESDRKAEGKVTELKDKYEKELQRLQAIIVEAERGSIVGTIRRKWGM